MASWASCIFLPDFFVVNLFSHIAFAIVIFNKILYLGFCCFRDSCGICTAKYVIRPILPRPFISTPSYNCWAILIVFCVEKLRAFEASCCNVLVVKGTGAFLDLLPFFTSLTVNLAAFNSFTIPSNCSFPWFQFFLFHFRKSLPWNPSYWYFKTASISNIP